MHLDEAPPRCASHNAAKPLGLASVQDVSRAVVVVRGQRVLLDAEVAALYGALTDTLHQAVRLNRKRFPKGVLFRLTRAETEALGRTAVVTEPPKHCGRTAPLYAFTVRGLMMAAHVLNSPRAVEISIYLVRVFVRLSEILASSNTEFARALNLLELQTRDHSVVDIVKVIAELMSGEPTMSERSIH